MAVKPIPDGYHSITPYLTIRNASAALDFYKKAFGAKEIVRMNGPDGKIAHAEMKIGDSIVMLGEESPARGANSPQTLGGSPVGIFLYVDNVDKSFEQATAAGAKADMPPTDMFWGDRYGKLTDPYGHQWSMATHKEDVAPAEMEKRMKAEMAKMAHTSQATS